MLGVRWKGQEEGVKWDQMWRKPVSEPRLAEKSCGFQDKDQNVRVILPLF